MKPPVEQTETPSPSLWRRIGPLLLAPVIALLIVAGCTQPTRVPSSPAPLPTPQPQSQEALAGGNPASTDPDPTADYVGSETCGTCHKAEWEKHRLTRHAHTLTPMTVAALGKKAPPEGLLNGINSAIAVADGGYVLQRPQTTQTRPLDYALGSGKQGMTYIAIRNGNAVFEMRRSYIPRLKQWYPTPGQEDQEASPDVIGKTRQAGEARQCILCHAVAVSNSDLHPEPRFMGVGCESCHGPGRAHIAAVKANQTADLKMEDLSKAGGDRINAVCGACHGTPEHVKTIVESQRLSQRFMPYGLSLSRCFKESGDRLSCTSCHNPHLDASSDPGKYERVCQSCHSPAGGSSATRTLKTAVCPVNPRTGCIGCHMPRRPVFAINHSTIPIAMADHHIQINRP